MPLLDADRLAFIGATLGAERIDAFLGLLCGQLEAAPTTLATLAGQGDWEAVRREAHTLKGAAGSAGAMRVAERAAALESNREAPAVKPLIAQLASDVTETLDAIAIQLGPERKSLMQ